MSSSPTPTPPPSPSAAQQVIVPPPELPAIPRAVTPQVAKFATFEPKVRFWFVLGAVFLVVAGYFGLRSMSVWMSERSMIESGVLTDATILEAADSGVNGQRKLWDSVIRITYDAGGQKIDLSRQRLFQKPNADLIAIGQTVPIRYDPSEPTRWTNRTAPPSLAQALIAVFVFVPVAVISIVVGLFLRSRAIGTWKTGKLTPAAVLSVQSSAIAPGYVFVSALPTLPKATSVGVYVKKSMANLRKGDVVWLLVADRGPALAARAFL